MAFFLILFCEVVGTVLVVVSDYYFVLYRYEYCTTVLYYSVYCAAHLVLHVDFFGSIFSLFPDSTLVSFPGVWVLYRFSASMGTVS